MIERRMQSLRRWSALLAIGLMLTGVAPWLTAPAAAQNDVDATPLLLEAVETMSAVQSFHFELTTVRGESTILDNLELAGVSGSVQRPDRFQATITAKVAIVEIDVDIIGVGARVWVTDPMASSDQYIEVTNGDPELGEQLTSLLNPDKLLLQAVGLVKEPTIDGVETIDGTRTTRVVGTVDLADLPQFGSATPEAAASDFLLLEEMPVTIWIDGDGHVIRMEVDGPLTRDESPDVIRRLNLYDFDTPVEIVEPIAS
ncbi:MAG: LppX_LprAFG lipoprotein [Thermomicrobiales bacterium]|nr:LppX_LprAFG lipoprotein [Thermomicrobiales bacterium]